MNGRNTLKVGIVFFTLLFVGAGCGQSRDEIRQERVHDLMTDVLEPAADGIWDAAGWIITEEGEQELWPTTDEGWQNVVDSADKVAETAELLKSPDYAAPQGDWTEYSDGMIVAADRARTAARDRDKQGLFDAGGHLYRVCVACHQSYMREDQLPMSAQDGS